MFQTPFRTISSGFVFFPRIEDIILLLVSFENLSGNQTLRKYFWDLGVVMRLFFLNNKEMEKFLPRGYNKTIHNYIPLHLVLPVKFELILAKHLGEILKSNFSKIICDLFSKIRCGITTSNIFGFNTRFYKIKNGRF